MWLNLANELKLKGKWFSSFERERNCLKVEHIWHIPSKKKKKKVEHIIVLSFVHPNPTKSVEREVLASPLIFGKRSRYGWQKCSSFQ